MKNALLILLALALGFAGGLAYAWLLAPVEYVDAAPSLLRADFKDQYRIVIAASYSASHDLARARARLALLSDSPLDDLNAQAQRMVGAPDAAQNLQLLAQLATDLQNGVAGVLPTATLLPTAAWTEAPSPAAAESALPEGTPRSVSLTATPTVEFIQTPFEVSAFTLTPLSTATIDSARLFVLIGQDEVCNSSLPPGLLQFTLVDSRRAGIPGVAITITSIEGEEVFFTGFKPEVGAGYADFIMKENVSYSARVGEGGAFVSNLSAPACNGFLGGLALAFQQR
ncbi:MAG: hypothetical protein Fur002_06470 [Anaerolineales bacterium]